MTVIIVYVCLVLILAALYNITIVALNACKMFGNETNHYDAARCNYVMLPKTITNYQVCYKLLHESDMIFVFLMNSYIPCAFETGLIVFDFNNCLRHVPDMCLSLQI